MKRHHDSKYVTIEALYEQRGRSDEGVSVSLCGVLIEYIKQSHYPRTKVKRLVTQSK